MSSRRWIESTRRWFLGLPQLQKTLVFGGLGMLSGWVTTGAIHGSFLLTDSQRILVGDILVGDVLLFLATCVLGPGLAFGVAVAGPIYFLNFGTVGGWLRSLIRVTVLHPVTLFLLTMLTGSAVAASRVLPRPEFLAVFFIGGAFGYLLAISCAPFAESDQRTRRLSVLVMGAAFGLVAWGEQSFQSGVPGMPLPIINLFRTASLLVTLHTAAAVCLSVRAWPELPKVAPPPLDDSAKLLP